jgi:glycosyltransferase involved in cell wall biosynthesis
MKYGMKMPKPVRYLGIQLLAIWRWPNVFINYILREGGSFPVELAVAAIMKNEGPYLKEWIEYHRMAGVEKFYLYDNESSDNTKEILEPYIQENVVDYVYFHGAGVSNQVSAYIDVVRRVRNSVKWLAIIDIDEFIVPVEKAKIIDVVNDLQAALWRKEHKKLFGLAVRWVQYGYGGHYAKPDGLVTENFRKNSGAVRFTKSIINPRAAFFYAAPQSVHTPMYLDFGFGRTETGEKHPWEAPISVNTIRVNHYFTKSYEEFRKKIERNKTGFPETKNILPEYDPDYMSRYEDPIMDKYAAALKRAVGMIKN